MQKHTVFNALKVFLLPVTVFVVFSFLQPDRFFNIQTIYIILQQSFIPSVVAWGLCFVMTLGMYDMSVGGILILVSILAGKLAGNFSGITGIIILFVSSVVFGTLVEMINATVYRLLRIPSLIVTIGLVMVYETVGNYLKGVVLPFEISLFGRAPFNIILGLIAMYIAYFIYNKTRIGIHIQAVGGSEPVAKNSGIHVDRIKSEAFVICGFFVGIASCMSISYGGIIMPSTQLDSISRIFPPMMGYFIGLALQKYCNMIVGIFIGEFVVNMITTGMIAINIPTTYQQVVTGFFLILVSGIASRGQKDEVVK